MTVESTTRKVTYAMDGVTVAFPFTFTALTSAPTDIKASIQLISTGAETELTYTTDYTAAINANGVGGTVTVADAQSNLYNLIIYRLTTNTQESDYEDFNAFPADTLETDLDKRTMIDQEQAEDIDRSITLPIGTGITSSILPAVSAGNAIGYNATGTAFANIDVQTGLPVGTDGDILYSTSGTWGGKQLDDTTIELDATNGIQVKDAGIGTSQLATNSVVASIIADLAVDTAALQTKSVTASKLEDALTFESLPLTPSVAPSADYQIPNKKYVDDSVPSADEKLQGWIKFNGTGTIAEYDSFNVSGITDNNTGDYTITWDTDFANINYCCSLISGTTGQGVMLNYSTGTVVAKTWDSNGGAQDNDLVCVIATGDQA